MPKACAAVKPSKFSASPLKTRYLARCISSPKCNVVKNSPLIGTGMSELKPYALISDFISVGLSLIPLYAFFEIMLSVVPVSTICLSELPHMFKFTEGQVGFRPNSLLMVYFISLEA